MTVITIIVTIIVVDNALVTVFLPGSRGPSAPTASRLLIQRVLGNCSIRSVISGPS